MKQLVVATTNPGKLREIAHCLDGLVEQLISLADLPDVGPIIEDGATFKANALIKASTVGRFTGLPTLADDSGLEVCCLGNRPGVHSARFAGEQATDAENNEKLLQEMAGVPNAERDAAFHCAMVLWLPGEESVAFDGYLEGSILTTFQGDGGFGYDPLFLVAGCDKTLADLTIEEKNGLSHRGRALEQVRSYLRQRG
jgi:XTP/dITP diphosphohydrolase